MKTNLKKTGIDGIRVTRCYKRYPIGSSENLKPFFFFLLWLYKAKTILQRFFCTSLTEQVEVTMNNE